MRSSAVFLIALFIALAACAAQPAPAFFGAAPGALLETKSRLARGDPSLALAIEKLKLDAHRALEVHPPSVMDKTSLPPSGDKHDYLSVGPYFWPDPASSNGLPYIRHDGRVNPHTRGGAFDHRSIGRMGGLVETLALAYYFTGNEAYAQRAALCLRAWFLDPATRMNPNFNYAQAVPGITEGRGTGIIEARGIAQAADAAQLLAGSPAWTAQSDAALKVWLNSFLDWLLTSKNGRAEAAARNNHGTFYDALVVRLALVLGKTKLARAVAEAAKEKRIAAPILPDGRQPRELARTASLGYCRFNTEALFELATLAQYTAVDLWHYQTPDGRSMRKALDFLLPFIGPGAKPWPYQQIRRINAADFAPLLRQAALAYGDPVFEALLHKLPGADSSRFQLLCPSVGPQN